MTHLILFCLIPLADRLQPPHSFNGELPPVIQEILLGSFPPLPEKEWKEPWWDREYFPVQCWRAQILQNSLERIECHAEQEESGKLAGRPAKPTSER